MSILLSRTDIQEKKEVSSGLANQDMPDFVKTRNVSP